MKFRRNKSDDVETGADTGADSGAELETGAEDKAANGAKGPLDRSEVDIDDEAEDVIDLGGLLIRATPGVELQMQVDEPTQQVRAVLLVGTNGAAELRPFAAPRNGDIWDDMRRRIKSEVAQAGGTADEGEGSHGPELRMMLTVQTPDGKSVQQPSRVVGIPGPRWLLRATFYGRPAVEPADDGDVETALRNVIVVRGTSPMPPGDALPLTLPPNASPVQS